MPFPSALSPSRQLEVCRLYQSGLSAQQVSDGMGVSLRTVFYMLIKHGIKRRTIADSNRIRFEAKPLSYNIKTSLTIQEQKLKLAAIMLYWAEGYKIGHTIDFANSDSEMALIFIRFLRDVCQVNEHRIRGHIYSYEGQDVGKLTDYWSNKLSLPKNQFTKPYVKKATTPGPRGPRMTNGLVHIVYCDKKLLRQMLLWIEEYRRKLTK